MVKLVGEDGLKHRQKQMFLSTLVLVAINCEHDGLEQRIDLGHSNETAKVGDMSRFGLQEEEQVAVLLRFVIVRKEAFLKICGLFEMACDFILLQGLVSYLEIAYRTLHTSSRAMRFWMSSAILESR